MKFYAVWFHLLLKMHPQYQAHHFLSLHHAKRVSKTSLFHFSSQPIYFQVALGKHFLKDRLQRCLLISSAMIIKSWFCRSLWDYQSLKRKFSSFSCSNIYSPPLHLRLSFTSRRWHPGQLHFHMHFLFKCQEGPLRVKSLLDFYGKCNSNANNSLSLFLGDTIMPHLQLQNTSEEVGLFFLL